MNNFDIKLIFSLNLELFYFKINFIVEIKILINYNIYLCLYINGKN